MTKIFATLAAVVTMATMSSAFTFAWGSGSGMTGRIQFGGDYIATPGNTANIANAAVYLVYLGADATWTFNDDGTTSDEIVQTGTVAAAGLVGRGYGTYDKKLETTFTDGSAFTTGSTFGVMVTYTVDGRTYYNYSATTYSVPDGVQDNTADGTTYNQTMNWDMDETGGYTPTAGGGWWTPIIPEPMTVICGLAGLALLLKRRA